MGPNRWLRGDAYPLPRTVFAEFYLASDAGANTTKGDGRLQRPTSGSGREFDVYVYDPGDPTPGLTSRMRQGGMKAYADITGTRHDILVFDTAPLGEPLNVVGPVSLTLYASTSAKDTDWIAYLAAVDESGTLVPVGRGMGMIRARFRNSLHKPELLEKGTVYEFRIDLWQTGRQIPKGWKLRLEISSAYAPTYSRNLNTGGHNEMETAYVRAEQRIYHSRKYPSRLRLPLVDLRNFE
jgi:putative CocE/NonD family hydrolase